MGPGESWLSFALTIALLALAIASGFYSVRMFIRRQSSPDPQKSRQIARIFLGPMILGAVIILAMGQLLPEKRAMSFLLSVPMIAIAVRFAWAILHEPTEADAVDNFAHDRERCGRCGYLVTGNVTGRCSECGWDFPVGELPTEEPDWSAWWRRWPIRHLREPRWHVWSYFGMGLYLFGLAVIFWMKGEIIATIALVVVGVHLWINGVRVVDYLRRQRRAVASGGWQ